MKIIVAMLLFLLVTANAFASSFLVQVFDNFSGGNGSVRYSTPVHTGYGYGDVYRHREVQFGGITAAGAFQNMSGHTVTWQCAATDLGPWSTCYNGTSATWAASANRGVQGNSFSWDGASYYIRMAFTRASSALNRISAWVTLSN